MEKLKLDNIERYITLNNELADEDPYILKTSKEDFVKNSLDSFKTGCIDIYVLSNDKNDIGFIQLEKDKDSAIIDKIYIKTQYRNCVAYENLLKDMHNYYSTSDIKSIKYIGVNDKSNLIQALNSTGYSIEKEHIQMERDISKLSNLDFSLSYRTFYSIDDYKLIYNFMKSCMEDSIFNYNEEEVNELLHMDSDLTSIIYDNNDPAGFVIAYINHNRNKQENKDVIYIEEIAVLKKYRNKGYGRKIMQFIMYMGKNKGMKTARLHVYKHNLTAYKLYKNLEFEEIKSIGHWVKTIK